jgi:hypothetical protein
MVAGLVRPEFVIEIEAIAAAAPPDAVAQER